MGAVCAQPHLANPAFERPSAELASLHQLLARLDIDLVSRQPAAARSAAQALLLAPANLLVSLIGESLTDRLLNKAWGDFSVAQTSKVKPGFPTPVEREAFQASMPLLRQATL
jgi:hypothetical protein